MKIVRGLGIVLSVLALAFVTIFNINEMMYRNSGNRIDIYGYKLMTIDNKYDYYLVKNTKINDIILYDNISYRVNSTDLSTDYVKGKKDNCLKLSKSSTIVCSNNLEGKVVMKVSGAREMLFANKGSVIIIVICVVLLLLVFFWKPKDKKKDNKKEVKDTKKPNNVVEISTEPFNKKEKVKEEEYIKEEEKPMMNVNSSTDQTVVIDTTPFKEEIKEEVQLPQEVPVENNVSEVDKFHINNNLDNQNIVDNQNTVVDTTQFEVNNDSTPLENINMEEYVPSDMIVVPAPKPSYEAEDVIIVPYSAPSNEEAEDVIVVPMKKDVEDDSLNDIIVVPYDKAMEKKEEPVKEEDYSQYSDIISVPVTYSRDKYEEFDEVIRVPIFRDEKDDYFDKPVTNDIFNDADINSSVEINLDDIRVDSSNETIKVTPIYSSEKEFNSDVEIL